MTEMRRSMSGATVDLKPRLDKVDPPAGSAEGGERVTISGTGLTNVKRVRFGEEEATDIRPVSATKLTCITPANAQGPCKVHAINEVNDDSNKLTFTYK